MRGKGDGRTVAAGRAFGPLELLVGVDEVLGGGGIGAGGEGLAVGRGARDGSSCGTHVRSTCQLRSNGESGSGRRKKEHGVEPPNSTPTAPLPEIGSSDYVADQVSWQIEQMNQEGRRTGPIKESVGRDEIRNPIGVAVSSEHDDIRHLWNIVLRSEGAQERK